jgi:hypothetical protein
MTVENLSDAELLAEHLLKYPKVLETMGANPFVQASLLLYNEIRRLRDGSKTESNGGNRA